MVCTLKHLSLCPEMEALYLFNPENDMALACGDPYYMAPASARRMAAEQMRCAHRSHYCRHDGPKNNGPKMMNVWLALNQTQCYILYLALEATPP